MSIPPPMPCTTRNAISCAIDCAVAHSSDPPMNAMNANMNVRFVPIRSPSQPDVGIHTARLSVYPSTIHSALPLRNSRPSAGSATFVIVVSRMSRNSAVT